MRLSEKTLELSICAQLTAYTSRRLIWFGLTQKQEARAGFDACTRLNGRLLILQFKASDHVLQSGARRFHLPHDQLTSLTARWQGWTRSVYYVFPLVGNTKELAANSDLIAQTRLLDVGKLPRFPEPTTRGGNPRKNRIHYADVLGGAATIHSDPVTVQTVGAAEVARSDFAGADGLSAGAVIEYWEQHRFLLRKAVAIVVL